MVKINIDNREYEAEEGLSILETALANGIKIPTFCYHPALKPSGSCKLCAVEMTAKSGRQITMLACILKAKEGLVVKTNSELVTRARTKAFRNLLQMAPQSKIIIDMAKENGIDLGPPPDGCVRCRLCIRVCKEIVGAGALKMEKREGTNYVVPIEGNCIGCGTCANLCKTDAIKVEDKDNVRTIYIRDQIIGKHPLQRCEGCGRLYATPKFLDHLKKRIVPHPEVKIHHNYCPTCERLFSDRIEALKVRTQKLKMPGHH